jgi:succinate dehydrogenase/fumarate reductase-like Fe-S protein
LLIFNILKSYARYLILKPGAGNGRNYFLANSALMRLSEVLAKVRSSKCAVICSNAWWAHQYIGHAGFDKIGQFFFTHDCMNKNKQNTHLPIEKTTKNTTAVGWRNLGKYLFLLTAKLA